MSTDRCLFCNCRSHKTTGCNSNMNGRRKLLDGMSECMLLPECPDFNSFPINELRYIAHNYVLYAKTTWPYEHMGNKYNRKYLRQPISLTLSKNRLVRALVDRWTGLAPVRALMSSPPENKDCPICYETMITHKWFQLKASWVEVCLHTYDAKYVSPMRADSCKHTFCGRCWGAHVDYNNKYNEEFDYYYVDCPMCRSKVYI